MPRPTHVGGARTSVRQVHHLCPQGWCPTSRHAAIHAGGRDASFRRDGITGQLPTLLEGHPRGIRLADFRSTAFAGLTTVLVNRPRATVRSALVAD